MCSRPIVAARSPCRAFDCNGTLRGVPLPLQSLTVAARAGSPSSRSNRIMAAKSGPTKILVVDDDVRLRDLLTRYLGEQGFQVAALADARDLDRKLQRDPPHLVVLDLMLPGEDGLSVCRRLRGAGEIGADHHADRQGRGRRSHRRPGDGRRRLPAEAVQSARARRAHPRGAAPARRAQRARRARRGRHDRVRPAHARPRGAHAATATARASR